MLKHDPERTRKALVLLACDEQAALAKVRRNRLWFRAAGFAVMFVSFYLAFNPSFGIPCWILAVVSSFGGALTGLSIWFEQSLAQWPVLKQYLDLERLRRQGAEQQLAKRP